MRRSLEFAYPRLQLLQHLRFGGRLGGGRRLRRADVRVRVGRGAGRPDRRRHRVRRGVDFDRGGGLFGAVVKS